MLGQSGDCGNTKKMLLLKAERKPLVPSVWQLSLRWEWEGEVGGYKGVLVALVGIGGCWWA